MPDLDPHQKEKLIAHFGAAAARSGAIHCMICITLMRLRIRNKKFDPEPNSQRSEKSDPNPHQSEKPELDADPDPEHWF
jgi:hypothetical protein